MKEKTVLEKLKYFKILLGIIKNPTLDKVKDFVVSFYNVDNMPIEFYEELMNSLRTKNTLKIISTENIYTLISYLKHNTEPTSIIESILSPAEYFNVPQKQINKIIKSLKMMPVEENNLSKSIDEEILWKLRRRPTNQPEEYQELAYKLYKCLGFETTIELINQKFGSINYEQLHFLIKNLEPQLLTPEEISLLRSFIFGNKTDFNIPIKQMLNGRFTELFINFDYFCNNISYFCKKLGIKLKTDKLKLLLTERYITSDPTTPELTGDIKDDMLSSYYHKYTSTAVSPEEVIGRNTDIYTAKLRNKFSSSIPQIKLLSSDEIVPELLDLSDPRNLTHGYRSGNCFRLNGDASILFSQFLDSEHMRILSFSTPEYKDYAMVLLMRNGNVLIAQGIETSKWVPSDLTGKKLYELTKNSLKQIMDYMNSNDDEIVGTIIGATNQNVIPYNQQVLPFLVSPIIENGNNYYNGISNYQCLLDLASSKTINQMKLYRPEKRYFDQRDSILIRQRNYPDPTIEKRIISLRYQRSQTDEGFSFYKKITNHQEQATICNKDWYVTLFTDGTIDSFIADTKDPRAKEEYQQCLAKVYQKKN